MEFEGAEKELNSEIVLCPLGGAVCWEIKHLLVGLCCCESGLFGS